MSVGYLLLVIGILPIVVGLALLRLYGVSRLTICIFLFMSFIGIWQIDVAVLYFKGILSEETILLLFKIFRVAATFVAPLVFYIILSMVDKKKLEAIGGWKERLILAIVKKWFLALLIVWSTIVYVVHLTPYGIVGLTIETTEHLSFYFPIYGPLSFLFIIHISIFAMIVLLLTYSIRYLTDQYIKRFMKTFSVCALLLFIPAFFNFQPNTGLMVSSIAVIFYSIIILVAYIQMYNDVMKNYQRVSERQQKLDSIGLMSSTLVHEVKNSLTIIKGYTDLLLKDEKLNDKQKEMLGFVNLGGEQLDSFVKSYSSFMKSNQLTFKMTDVKRQIENIVTMSKEQFKEIDFSYRCKNDSINGYVSQAALYQVIVNLIKNSVEAISEQKFPKIDIELFVENEQINIDVIDNGFGISASDFESVFQPFYSSKESSGLGLAFCKKIIIEHRGCIKIINSNSKGTHIRVSLPQFEYSMAVNV
jgi:signal transduction histidine kinase